MTAKGIRRTLVIRGRQDARVTIVVEVYRRSVWVTVVDVPLVSEGIFEPAQVDRLVEMLIEAARQAQESTKNRDRTTENGSAI